MSRLFAALLLVVFSPVAASAQANQPPKAVASVGGDPNTGQVLHSVTLYLGPSDTGIAYTVSGSGSSDPDGDPLKYLWQCTDGNSNKCLLQFTVVNVSGVRAQFPAGTYHLALTVTDPSGASASDAAQVKVLVDNVPPTVTPPHDEGVSATEGGGARGSDSNKLHDFLFNSATATDNSTAVFTHLPPQINGVDVDDSTLLPHGTTTVTFRIADVYGNVGAATADVSVTDLEPGDLFVGVQSLGATQFKGAIQRIRGGAVTDYCVSPDPTFAPAQSGDPVFWNRPDQIVVDSKGRVAFLAPLNYGTTLQPSIQNGWGLLRCNRPGEIAEQLGVFPTGNYIDPGWYEPLPGKRFYTPGLPPSQPLTGLHLRKRKYISIDDDVNGGSPQIVTDERYVFAYHESSIPDNTAGTIGNLSVNVNSLDWEHNDLEEAAVGSSPDSPQNLLPEMFFHSKTETVSFLGIASFPAPVAKTYVARFGTLRRIHQPLEVLLTAGGVQFGVQAFAGATEMPGDTGIGGLVMDDMTIPNLPSGCNSFPPVRSDWPKRLNTYAVLQTDGVIFENNSGLVINSGFSMPGWTGHVDEALFDLDPQNDPASYFAVPEIGCLARPVVNFAPVAGGASNPSGTSVADLAYDVDLTGWGFHPDRMAASPDGLFGTQGGSPYTGVSTGRVVQATGARELVEVASGLLAPKGLGAYPPQLGNVQLSALIIRIDSPVDVVLTDSIGRRVGVVDGQGVNEFGSQAHDTGATTHPRLYIIQYPQAGNYTLRSIGTGSGPFTVHVYSVDSEKKVTEHISRMGAAQPGSTATHDFELNEFSSVAFANSTPMANAGFDQTADANAGGDATFGLDGSLSSDPDGDTLTFTWAGPFGILSGARVNATLPAGMHVIKLTVDDGKGGSAESSVQLTVNAVAPPPDTTAPVLTLPANIVVTASSAAGAVVDFTATATDDVDGSVPVICVPASGATFVVGTTTVNCSATDVSNNSASGSFSVTVNPAPSTPCARVTFKLSPGSAVLTQVHVTLIDKRSGAALHTFDAAIGIPRAVPAGKYRLLITVPAGYKVTPEHRRLRLKCGDDVRVIRLHVKAVPKPNGKGKK